MFCLPLLWGERERERANEHAKRGEEIPCPEHRDGESREERVYHTVHSVQEFGKRSRWSCGMAAAPIAAPGKRAERQSATMTVCMYVCVC